MMQVGANQSTTYHSQPSLATSSGQTGRSASTSRQQQSQYDTEQLANIRPRLCLLRKWPHYDGYGVHLARNQHWLGLRIGDVEPNSPAESGGLLSEDVVLAVNGHSVENDDFFVILSFIQHELEDDQIRFLVLDPHSADLARRHHLNIDENYRTCVRMETPTLTVSPEKLLYDQWRTISNADPTAVQNTINLGPTVPLNQNQPTSSQQHQEKLSREGPDVYTFLPYSDHAIENGKSFFDILFHQENKSPSTKRQQQPQDSTPQTPSKSRTGDNNDNKHKNQTSIIDHGIENLVDPNIGAVKSVPPTKHDEDDDDDSISNDHLIDRNPTTNESPLLKNEYKDEVAKPNNASNSNDQIKPPPPYESLWQASSQQEDTNNNLRPEPRMCSITLRPGIDIIGISLQPDKDFGHIIKHVEPSSLANRAGIEPDDCIVSLNHTPLLNIPYEDVLNTLKKNRNDSNLDFVVAKKSYLLKSRQKSAALSNTQSDPPEKYSDTTSNTTAEVLPSSNISGRDIPSTTGAAEALEELYNKYSNDRQSPLNDQTNSNRPRETVSTTTTTDGKHDRLSSQLDDDRYAKKPQQGQILQGVGPATADRSSWGVSSGKSSDLPAPISGDSSVRSNIRGRQPDTDDTKGRGNTLEDAFKPLQVGITNQTGNISPTPPSNLSSRPTSSIEQRDSSPKALQISDTTPTSARGDIPSSRQNQFIQNIPTVIPIVPINTYSTPDYEQKTSQVAPSNQSDLRLENTCDYNTIPTKPMSVPSNSIKANVPSHRYDDDTDDDLSDISERSREDDTSEPMPNKLSQVLSNESDNGAAPYSESLRKPIVSGIHTPETTPNYGDEQLNFPKDINNKQALSAPMPDVDQPSIVPSTIDRRIVQARRLEQSDSEDTMSGADSHNARRSIGDTFYSPDESMSDMNDIDDQQSKPLPTHLQQSIDPIKSLDNKQDQYLSKPLNQQQTPKNDFDEDSDRSIESNSENTPVPSEKMKLATMSISELKNDGYEFHNIQLMQPTETSPVGLKLTKQQDPFQYIITAVAKGTKADLAGLKVNDWLIKIENTDIRTAEFSEVSRDIRDLLTNTGLINMVIARKKISISPSTLQKIDKESTPISSSSRADSLSRQQGGQIPASLLTTDITRDTPDNNQVRFVPDRSVSPPASRSQRSPVSNREINTNAPGGPYSVGLTNPISDENLTKSPRSRSRSPSHSPTREYAVSPPEKKSLEERPSEEYDDRDIRLIVLKEALGLDFNSFIPENDSQIQTHFISNVQPLSLADKAGLRDGDRILTVNDIDVTHAIHEDVRRMMQTKKPLQLTVVNDPKYIELIESVKRNQSKIEGNTHDKKNSPPLNHTTVESLESDSTGRSRSPVKSVSNDPISDLKISPSKSLSPPPPIDEDEDDELSKHRRVLFTDDKGSVKIKHCILRKDPTYNGYGLVLRYQNGLHLIDQVEEDSPAYITGLREDDIILYADKKNVEHLTHDDVKILIRKLSVTNMDIDLILMKKSDIPRYKNYEEKNSINWKPILDDNRTEKTEQSTSSSLRGSNDQTNNQRKSSSSSNKQTAPVAPASSTSSSNSNAGTRTCILQPSADRTAGFALSGKTAPPYVICQVERGSPAEKAGLLINDAVLSINGKSVTETTYEETVKLIKEALQKKNVELVVRERLSNSEDNTTNQDPAKFSLGSIDNSNLGNQDSIGGEPSQQGANAVEEYQKQRNKELSYTLRLCHLLATNADGTQAATFGFELSEDPDYEYPVILRVESQSPADVAGLQSRDVLLKINERKTKGLGYDKVRKEIEKAKRDGRLEMLVVDQETYDYCERTNKPLKEPEMKVKHIFPKSRSSANFLKLPSATAVAAPSSMSPRDSTEQLSNSNIKSNDSIPSYNTTEVAYHSPPRETGSESEDDHSEKPNTPEDKSSSLNASQVKPARQSHPAVSFDLSSPANTLPNVAVRSHESPLKFVDPAQVTSQQRGASSAVDQNAPTTSRSTATLNQTSTIESKPSKAKSIPNAINNLFHKIGYSKSSKPAYDTPPKTKVNSKTRAPSPPTIRVGLNRVEESCVSQSLDTIGSNTITAPISTVHDTVRSTVSTGSFDYLRNPRRCVLKVDRNKGLGFVLSATGDYDHTITAVEKYSAADIAGLQVHDEVFEVDGVNVRNVKYEQVVEMLVSAMRANDTIEMRVIEGSSRDVYPSTIDVDKQTNPSSLLNTNNNNNTAKRTNHSQHTGGVSGDDLSDMNSSISPFDSLNQQKIATSYPNLHGQLRHLDHITNRALSGSVPVLATGITASPNSIHLAKNISISSEKGSMSKLSDISTHDAPVARLCRIRKFATSPFYGFFLCGDPKKLGRVFISDIIKHSPAAVCGLRDGDRVIEINGSSIDGLIYETILDKIKYHMGRDDLELLVLDKKSVQWYRERHYPITSRTLPTIVHIEPIINDTTSDPLSSEIPATHTKLVGFADRRVSKTGL
ncbi:unnamed protein product [Rotaria magnacalcarata]|uniref:PDZ domain-containing protein n=3 Tax=Rotaria magnacalcarata TaxID=392030 RepID=A0A815YDF8_9BILA|nr:unnamed protein product [Rotaria magnacalcarata]